MSVANAPGMPVLSLARSVEPVGAVIWQRGSAQSTRTEVVAQAVSLPARRTSRDDIAPTSRLTLGKVTEGEVTVAVAVLRPFTQSSRVLPSGEFVATWTL